MKVYVLNERRTAGLNKSAKVVTAQDVKTAFTKVAELYGGMTEDEARYISKSRTAL